MIWAALIPPPPDAAPRRFLDMLTAPISDPWITVDETARAKRTLYERADAWLSAHPDWA